MTVEVAEKEPSAEAPANDSDRAVYVPEMTIPAPSRNRLKTFRQVLIMQLIFLFPTIIQAIILLSIEEVGRYIKTNLTMVYLSLALYATSTLIFTFLPNMHTRNPYSILSAMIMVESLTAIIVFISAYYPKGILITSLGATVIACATLTAIGIYCTLNLDRMNMAVFTLGVIILIFGIIIYAIEAFVNCYTVNTVYSALALFVMYIYFFHAVQGLSDKTKHVDESEKFIVAMYLYTNFITIFLLCENLFSFVKI